MLETIQRQCQHFSNNGEGKDVEQSKQSQECEGVELTKPNTNKIQSKQTLIQSYFNRNTNEEKDIALNTSNEN